MSAGLDRLFSISKSRIFNMYLASQAVYMKNSGFGNRSFATCLLSPKGSQAGAEAKRKISFVSCNGLKKNRVGSSEKKICIIFLVKNF